MDWLGFVALNVLIITSPFAISKVFERPTLSEELYLQLATVALVIFYLLVRIYLGVGFRFTISFLDVSVLLFYGAILVSSALSYYKHDNSINTSLYSLKRSFLPFAFLATYFLAQSIMLTERRIRLMSGVILGVAMVVAIYGIVQYVFGVGLIGYVEEEMKGKLFVLSTLGHPNYVSAYLIIVMMFSGGYFCFVDKTRFGRMLGIGSAFTLFLCIMMAGARGAWVGMIIGAAFFLIAMRFLVKVKIFETTKGMIGVVAAILLILIVLSFPNPITSDRFVLTKRIAAVGEVQSRFYSWRIAIEMLKTNPAVGIGYGNYEVDYWDYVDEFQQKEENRVFDHLLSKQRGVPPKMAHNEYLQIAAETGGVGIALFFLILAVMMRMVIAYLRLATSHQMKKIVILISAGVLAFLVDCLFSFSLHLPISGFYFWLLLGLFNNIFKNHGMVENKT